MKAISYRLLLHAHLLAGEVKGQVMVLSLDESGHHDKLKGMVRGLDFETVVVTKTQGAISISGRSETRSFKCLISASSSISAQIKEAVSICVAESHLQVEMPVICLATSDEPDRVDTLLVLGPDALRQYLKR